MTVLVAGRDRVDAGKTTFSTGLIERTGAIGFKPRAGNDYWFHHDDYRHAVDKGRLFGKDARRLAAASPGTLDPEDINPVHRLWRPSPGAGSGLLGQTDREFLVDRVDDEYIVNETVTTPDPISENLPLKTARRVSSIDELNEVMREQYLDRLEALHRTITGTERAVVESYSDIARPIQALDPVGVAVVEPTRVRLFDGDRYRKGCAVATGGHSEFEGRLEERVEDVVDLIDPVATVALPALTEAKRHDPASVARAYGPAYDELSAIVGWS